MRMIDADMLADGLKLHRQSTDQKHETDRQWAVGYNAGLERALYSISYAPTLTPPNEWVSVEERLPEDSECWRTYIVTVNRSHWPTSSYDICDAPYDEQLVASAQYDSKQKIWHLPWDEQLNALIQAYDAPLNGDFVTHWMPLPKSQKEDE